VNFLGRTLSILFFVSPLVHADNFDKVGKRFHIQPLLLKAIARKESHMYNHAVNHTNSDRSEDVCMMGINSSHYKRLEPFGISRKRMMEDPMICVAVGAWVLNGFFEHYGRSWDSVGMYNTGPNPKLKGIRTNYAASVRRIYQELAKESGERPDPFAR